LLTWIWLIFGAIQLRYRNFPSPFMQLPAKKTEFSLTPGPSPRGEGSCQTVSQWGVLESWNVGVMLSIGGQSPAPSLHPRGLRRRLDGVFRERMEYSGRGFNLRIGGVGNNLDRPGAVAVQRRGKPGVELQRRNSRGFLLCGVLPRPVTLDCGCRCERAKLVAGRSHGAQPVGFWGDADRGFLGGGGLSVREHR